MKKSVVIPVLLASTAFGACMLGYALDFGNRTNKMTATVQAAPSVGITAHSNDEQPVVYMTEDISPEGLIAVYDALDRETDGNNVAVKISTGEGTASNYLRPELIGDLVHKVNGTIVECNTAVGGRRSSTALHYRVAEERGFTEIADVDILDETDTIEIPVEGGRHLSSDRVGANFKNYDYQVVLSHFKGHLNGGFGGAIKNMSIGYASSEGKNRIHTAGAVDTAWLSHGAAEQDDFLESMAEAAKAVRDYCGENILYINVMNRLSVDCDCDPTPREPTMADIGILASTDPVALDQACVDLVYAAPDGKDLVARIESLNGQHTLDYGQEIGLGSKNYKLVSIDGDYNITAEYNNGILTINGLDGEAKVIKASYNASGVLIDVKLYDAVNGENEIPAKAGDRLYIWDSLTGMHPLYDQIIITEKNETKTDSETADGKSEYTDKNGVTVTIPDKFRVSEKIDEQTVSEGLVVIGPDESEFVWVPITETEFARHDYNQPGFYDEAGNAEYQAMKSSAEKYGGFYMGRYEASRGAGDNIPASKKADSDEIWVHIPPQDMITVCGNLYADNETVTGFLPWGINWDTTLTWLIDSGCKTEYEVVQNSTSWGNYYNNTFADYRGYGATGQWEETKANNIYDLAGNYWEWTQERYGDNYSARAGGYTIMGGACNGDRYPVVIRSGLPGNDHHPNISFRVALYLN